MANYYVWSGATGTANGLTWANAYLTLTTAIQSKSVGDVFYVAHDHAEVIAGGITLQPPGTIAQPGKIICVDRAGSVPPVSADRRTTGSLTTTGNQDIIFNGFGHYDGIIFNAGSTATGVCRITLNNVVTGWNRFDNCSLRILTTGAGYIVPANGGFGGGSAGHLNNTTISFAAAANYIICTGTLKWNGGAILGVPPTTLFQGTGSYSGGIECIGVDFSLMGAGCTIVGQLASAQSDRYRFVDCKFNAAVTKSAAPTSIASTEIDCIRCGSAGNYTVHYHRYGALLTEETSVVCTTPPGATDGTTPLSWKIAATANCAPSLPFETPPIAVWNDTVGSPVTATVEGTWLGLAPPLNSECFLELEFLGDPASPLGSFKNDAPADILAAPAAQTVSSATWGGLATPVAAYDPATATAATLSGSNLVVTSTGTTSADQGARGIGAMGTTSGKFYFETTITNQAAGGNFGFGVCITTAAYTTLGTSGTGGAEMFPASGNIWANGSNSGFTLGGRATGQVIGIAVDLTNRKAWFKKVDGTPTNWNGNATHDPATNVGGVTIPAGTVLPSCTFGGTGGVAGAAITSNFGATAFVGAVPSGFASGYPLSSIPRPFKLDATFTPQQKGWIYARAKIGKPSTVFYIDPKVTLS